MNKYKKINYILQVFFWLVTIGIVLSILIPPIKYNLKNEAYPAIEIKSNAKISGLEWILKNKKWSPVETNKANLIYVNDASKFDPELMARIDDNIFIGEMLFSQFGGDIKKHEFIENLFDTSYTGFLGKTCVDLSDKKDIPEEIIKNYETSTGEPWRFYGKGIILTNTQNVIVLEEGRDYKGKFVINTDKGRFEYTGFFEVLASSPKAVSTFRIPILPDGEKKLEAVGLDSEFSAEIVVSNRVFDGVYYAGQFSETPVDVPISYQKMPQIMRNKGLYDDKRNESLYWKWYYPKMAALLEANKEAWPYTVDRNNDENNFYIEGQTIYLQSDGEDKPFFVKGVNLGAALPGKTFTEFPTDKTVYRIWFEQMSALNINTLRVYTLLPPTFYQALYEYNSEQEKPIYLLQEIWPEEYPEEHNYLGREYNETYQKEIEYVVHAIHGNMNIPTRNYRAYGVYQYDVSPYLLGYLVGREMEPEEVRATDEINEGYEYVGNYLYGLKGASPTEAWLAQSCDYALAIEDLFYGDSPLVAIVSWPTLDPRSHDSEWSLVTRKERKFNDNTVVDINHIGINKETVSGFFGAYHIYPNYPDFMNNELVYNNYQDDQGRFRYGGYLKEFMAGHRKYPAIVAEYGISTSQTTSHYSPDGYNHGGMSEVDQGKGIIRMTDAIVREGYSGAIIFEWMDEWAKKTWSTEPYMIPYAQNQYWHNKLDPEQNYGLLAIEGIEPTYVSKGTLSVGQNASYLYLKMDVRELEKELKLSVGDIKAVRVAIDTIKESPRINEFILEIGPTSQLLVNPGYNWIKGNFHSTPTSYDSYEHLLQLVNSKNTSMFGDIMEERKIDYSTLKYGTFKNPLNTVYFDGTHWIVRIPYGVLGISDPSKNKALSDTDKVIPISRDQIDTEVINDVTLTLMAYDKEYNFKLHEWEIPEYNFRLKESFVPLAEYFKTLN